MKSSGTGWKFDRLERTVPLAEPSRAGPLIGSSFTHRSSADYSSDVGETVFTRPRPRPRQYWRGRGDAAENQAEARQPENHVNVAY